MSILHLLREGIDGLSISRCREKLISQTVKHLPPLDIYGCIANTKDRVAVKNGTCLCCVRFDRSKKIVLVRRASIFSSFSYILCMQLISYGLHAKY